MSEHRRRRLLTGIEQLEDRSLMAVFTPGDLAVYRVGNGSANLASTGNPVFIDEYTPNGGLVQSIAMSADTVNAGNANTLIAHGALVSEGMLTRSVDNQSLAVPGYNVAVGNLVNSSSQRVIGLVGVDGNLDLSTTGTFNNGKNLRGAVRSGSQIFTVGGAVGTVLISKGTSSGATTISSGSLMRTVSIFDGQLYISTASGSLRLATIGSGIPITTGQTATNLPGFPTAGSPYQFYLTDLSPAVAGVDTLYVADDTANGGEIQKFSLSGGTWTAQGAIAATAVRGLTGVVSGSTVTLFGATGGNTSSGGGSLYTFTDTTGYNASVSGTATTIATAATKTAFRGVALVPDDGIAAIGGVGGSSNYLAGDAAISLAGSATFSDQSNFKGGSLTVHYLSGGKNTDALSIVAGNGIVAASGSVFYAGTQIGSYPTSGVGSGLAGNSLTITFNAVVSANSVSAAAVQALLRQISFGTSAAASAGARLIELHLQQNDGLTTTASTTVSVSRVNQAPIANNGDISTDEDQAVGMTLSANDADGDSLSYVITTSPTHGTLSGTAPNLTYTPEADFHGTDSVTFKVNDGSVDSGEATISITVDPVNDAPVLGTDLPNLYSIKQGTGNPYGTPVWVLVTDVTDVDVGDPQGQGIAIEGLTGSANGTWQYTIDGAVTWHPLGAPTPTSALVLKVGVNNTRVRFLPHASFSGVVTLKYRAWDQSDGAASGNSVNVSGSGSTGGTTAYSSASRNAKLIVNNAPVVSAAVTPALTAIQQNAANPYGTPVWQLGAGVSDVNAGAVRGIAIQGATGSAHGTWQYTIDNAVHWKALGSPDAASALVLKADGNNTRVRFLPNAGFSGAVTLSYRAWDQSDGVASGGKVDISAAAAIGGTTAYSSASRTARLIVNDAPVLSTSVNPTLNTIAKNTTNPYGTPLWQLGLGTSDKNSGALRGIAIQNVTGSAHGTWQYTLDGGASWLNLGSPSLSSVRVLHIDGNRTRIRFVPNLGFSGTVSLDYRAWDLTDGTAAGGTVDISAAGATGGATAYSKVSRTALLTIT